MLRFDSYKFLFHRARLATFATQSPCHRTDSGPDWRLRARTVMSQLHDGRIAALCGSPSYSALPRDVDWQVLDARLLNRLWVELHQRQYFLRHTHFDGEPQLAGFSCSECVVMRPMSAR